MKPVWGWMPELPEGMWRHVPSWLRPLFSAVPWITAGILLLMLQMVGGTLTRAEGVIFDLPETGLSEGEATPLVALVLPLQNETCVFFDDARYSLDESVSMTAFGEHLAERVAKVDVKALLVLSDKRVVCGDISKVAAIARASGLERILFANKSEATQE